MGGTALRGSALGQAGIEVSQYFDNSTAVSVSPESSSPIVGACPLPLPSFPRLCPIALLPPPAHHYLEAFILKPAQGSGDPFFQVCL